MRSIYKFRQFTHQHINNDLDFIKNRLLNKKMQTEQEVSVIDNCFYEYFILLVFRYCLFYLYSSTKRAIVKKVKIKKRKLVKVKKISIDKKEKDKKTTKLTKKQRKKIRITKANKIINPGSKMFNKFKAVNRRVKLEYSLIGNNFYVHDGYSWSLISATMLSNRVKAGSLSFKTRSLSPIKFDDKGTKVKMAQLTTYKIRNTKVKRKK